ncbi:synaptonemal complex central element protein 2 [Sorex fumeus]|uniref:synaptonemal complex central element protein 2 n=1 Tax=Sorex fumeus TaxID=62283 RepID=UPI0024AE5315|nr:synaptonemal complex central element protein 2 [Sorex fumeus]
MNSDVPAPTTLTQVDGPLVLGGDLEPLLGAESRDLSPEDESHEEETVRVPTRSPLPSPAMATSSAGRQLIVLEGKLGPYFSSLDSSIESLRKRAQDLIENINESRQKDHSLMSNFRDNLKTKISEMTEKLEEKLYQVYNHHNKIIQEKLQEFTQKMAKISNLEMELKQVCHTMENVYKDLCVQPEV